jgi:hypothetical protein
MGVNRGLTVTQRDLCDRVCATATTLEDRLRTLRQHTWRGADGTDVEAVRAWLLDLRDCEG